MPTPARVIPTGGRRQILPTLDLRTQAQKQGITPLMQSVQAITGILQTVGAAEQKRRERQQLDRISRAIAGGATTAEAILAAANQPATFGGGLQGILQKVGGAFQPPGGGIRQNILQSIIGQRLKESLVPKPLLTIAEQRAKRARETEAVPGTAEFEKIAKGPTKLKPFTVKQTGDLREKIKGKLDKIKKRDIPGIGEGQRKNVHFQEDIIKAYKEALLGFELNKREQKQFDRIWDSKAKKLTPIRLQKDSEGNIIKVGWNPNSPEVKQARKELRAGAQETVTPETVTPETVTPETVTPETVTPETVAPETGVIDPDTKAKLKQILAEGDPVKINEALRLIRETFGQPDIR